MWRDSACGFEGKPIAGARSFAERQFRGRTVQSIRVRLCIAAYNSYTELMSISHPLKSNADQNEVRKNWLLRISDLVANVDLWAQESGWSTRVIKKRMNDSLLGDYQAPALILQFETVKVLLDPVARFVDGTDGVVDLYLMPAYDDIASLYLHDGTWQVLYSEPGKVTANRFESLKPKPFSRESFLEILDAMKSNGN